MIKIGSFLRSYSKNKDVIIFGTQCTMSVGQYIIRYKLKFRTLVCNRTFIRMARNWFYRYQHQPDFIYIAAMCLDKITYFIYTTSQNVNRSQLITDDHWKYRKAYNKNEFLKRLVLANGTLTKFSSNNLYKQCGESCMAIYTCLVCLSHQSGLNLAWNQIHN